MLQIYNYFFYLQTFFTIIFIFVITGCAVRKKLYDFLYIRKTSYIYNFLG
jgi:hypothetical protein